MCYLVSIKLKTVIILISIIVFIFISIIEVDYLPLGNFLIYRQGDTE